MFYITIYLLHFHTTTCMDVNTLTILQFISSIHTHNLLGGLHLTLCLSLASYTPRNPTATRNPSFIECTFTLAQFSRLGRADCEKRWFFVSASTRHSRLVTVTVELGRFHYVLLSFIVLYIVWFCHHLTNQHRLILHRKIVFSPSVQ